MDFRNLAGYKNKNLDSVEIDGRRYLTNSEFTPSVIIGMAFGSNYGENSHNYKLATCVLDAGELFGREIPVISPIETKKCFVRNGERDLYFVGEDYEEGEKRLLVSKMNTGSFLECCRDTINQKRLGWEILYVAHPAHMQRVLNTGEKQGLGGIPFVSEKTEWVADAQPWVCNPWIWVPREIVARIIG